MSGLLSLLAGVVSGVAPALRATSALATTLSESTRTFTSARSALRNLIVVVELALALMLLIGAGLMTRTFLHLRSVDLGFHADDVAALTVDLPDDRYRTATSLHAFQERMEAELERLPGVRSVAAVDWRPLSATYISGDFSLEGGGKPPSYFVLKPCVSTDYFKVMGIAFRQGRAFDGGDNVRSKRVVVVSQSVADRFWPNGDAIGKRITMADAPKESDWMTIVGVVDDITQDGVTSAKGPAIYQAIAQVNSTFFINHLTFTVLTEGDPARLLGDMRRTLHDTDPMLPAETLGTMQSLVGLTIAEPLFQTRLLAVF